MEFEYEFLSPSIRSPTVKEYALVVAHQLSQSWRGRYTTREVARRLGCSPSTATSKLTRTSQLYLSQRAGTGSVAEDLVKQFVEIGFLAPIDIPTEESISIQSVLVEENRGTILQILVNALSLTNTGIVAYLRNNNIQLTNGYAEMLLLDISPLIITSNEDFMNDLLDSGLPELPIPKKDSVLSDGEISHFWRALIHLGWYHANNGTDIITFLPRNGESTNKPQTISKEDLCTFFTASEINMNLYREEGFEAYMISLLVPDLIDLIISAVEFSRLLDGRTSKSFRTRYKKWDRERENSSLEARVDVEPVSSLINQLVRNAVNIYIETSSYVKNGQSRSVALDLFLLVYDIDLILPYLTENNSYDHLIPYIESEFKLEQNEYPDLEQYIDAHIRSAWIAAQQALRTLHSNE